ncbi:hypothetical protein [Paraburkholderia dipogonis]|uniref:hypothetical protein n=1 Tax=Paraburkholderia dipogonis TaxID=1211383 RepID=UPI0038BE03AF
MTRQRTIAPGFFSNEHLASIDPLGRLLFAGLWCLADRDGRLEDRPARIRGELFPYEIFDADVLLAELDMKGFIHRYAVRGTPYIEIVQWRKYQHPHPREVKSMIPPCADCKENHCQGQTRDMPRSDQGNAKVWQSPSGSSGSSSKPKTLNPKEYPALADTAREDRPDIPEVKEAERGGKTLAVALVPRSRAAAIALLTRSNGAQGCNAANPVVIGWADDPRVTDDLLLAAIAKAKSSGSNAPGPNYLAPIIAQLLDPKPARRNRDAWRRTPKGIEAKASELGLYARPGESHDTLRERCESELHQRDSHDHGAQA